MVHVVLAGGSGSVGGEVLDAILSKNKHRVTVFTRREQSNTDTPGVEYVQVDYENKTSLVNALRGVDVVLSFITDVDFDRCTRTQKRLIDACIEAGVRRFSPSEWSTRSPSASPFYIFKDQAREYLEHVNKDGPVLEYSLFQPGLFTNFFTWPHRTTQHFRLNAMFMDLENRRALIPGDGNYALTLTTIEDMAAVVAEAIEFQGQWPVVGGIQGAQMTVNELIDLAKKIRGRIDVESVPLEDLRNGELKTSWYPDVGHPSIPLEVREQVSRGYTAGVLQGITAGSWMVSDDWNKILPDYRFTSPEEYLTKAWHGKP